jgi:hypothetical protein
VRNHLDGNTKISKACREWVKSHFGYESCVAKHVGDENFYGGQWRIYLNRTWELWDDSREVITLYDSSGLLVDQLSY